MKPYLKIFIFAIILLAPILIRGQPVRVQIGVEGGPSLATLRYDLLYFPSKYLEGGLGGTIGITFECNINNRIAIMTNLSFETKGNGNTFNTHDHLNYIILPVLFHVKFGKIRNLFVNIGPYFGYLLPMTDYQYYYKKFDLGITLGFGAEIPIVHQFGLTIEIRDNLGLFNVSKNLTYTDKLGNLVTDIGNLYTHSIVVQAGFIYYFGQKSSKN